MEDDKLVEIAFEDWPKLCDMYKDQKSQTITYNMLQNYINWKANDETIEYPKLYSLNGDWSDGTFIAQDNYLILFDIVDKYDADAAERLFKALRLLDFSKRKLLNGYDSRLQPVVNKLTMLLDLDNTNEMNGSYDLYVLPYEEALELGECTIPEDVRLRPLSEDHAKIVDKIWSFRHEGSLSATEKLIKHGKSLGAFTQDDDIVGYIIVQQTGAMGFLKVEENYRLMGVAGALIKYLAREIAAEGQDVMTNVAPANLIAEALFLGMGFRRMSDHYMNWTFLQPQ